MLALCFIVFLDIVGFGMIIPVFPFYAEQVGVPPSMVIFFLGLYSAGQLVGAPIWGALSDRIGRRPVLLISLAANVAGNLLLATATTPGMLAFSRIVSGLAAGNISTAFAYVADVTTEKTRPKSLGMLGASFALGFILGPALGGILAGGGHGGGIAVVAHVAAGMSALAFLATAFTLKESLSREHRATAQAKPRGRDWSLIRRPGLNRLLGANLIVYIAMAMFQSTVAVWGAAKLNLGPRQLGYVYGFAGLVSAAVQGGAIGKLSHRFGVVPLARTGAILMAISIGLIPVSAGMALLTAAMGIFGLGGALYGPSSSGLAASFADPAEQGAVLGFFQGASSLGRAIGPFGSATVAHWAGLDAPFVVGALVGLVGAAMIPLHAGTAVPQAEPGGEVAA